MARVTRWGFPDPNEHWSWIQDGGTRPQKFPSSRAITMRENKLKAEAKRADLARRFDPVNYYPQSPSFSADDVYGDFDRTLERAIDSQVDWMYREFVKDNAGRQEVEVEDEDPYAAEIEDLLESAGDHPEETKEEKKARPPHILVDPASPPFSLASPLPAAAAAPSAPSKPQVLFESTGVHYTDGELINKFQPKVTVKKVAAISLPSEDVFKREAKGKLKEAAATEMTRRIAAKIGYRAPRRSAAVAGKGLWKMFNSPTVSALGEDFLPYAKAPELPKKKEGVFYSPYIGL